MLDKFLKWFNRRWSNWGDLEDILEPKLTWDYDKVCVKQTVVGKRLKRVSNDGLIEYREIFFDNYWY